MCCMKLRITHCLHEEEEEVVVGVVVVVVVNVRMLNDW